MIGLLPPVAKIWLIGWRMHNYISNHTQMVSRPFDVCRLTTTDSSKVQSGSFYKSFIENASKHLQNDKAEDLLVLRFHTLIPLGSLKKKEKQILFILTD